MICDPFPSLSRGNEKFSDTSGRVVNRASVLCTFLPPNEILEDC